MAKPKKRKGKPVPSRVAPKSKSKKPTAKPTPKKVAKRPASVTSKVVKKPKKPVPKKVVKKPVSKKPAPKKTVKKPASKKVKKPVPKKKKALKGIVERLPEQLHSVDEVVKEAPAPDSGPPEVTTSWDFVPIPKNVKLIKRVSPMERAAYQAIDFADLSDDKAQNTGRRRALMHAAMERTEKMKREAKNMETEENAYAGKVLEWRRDINKITPSQFAISFFEERGEWRQNNDGTFTGIVGIRIPHGIIESDRLLNGWVVDLEETTLFLDQEPLWLSVGMNVNNVVASREDRYEQIIGQTATAMYWRSNGVKEDGTFRSTPRMSDLMQRLEKKSAYLNNVKGLGVTMVFIMAAFSPVRPIDW